MFLSLLALLSPDWLALGPRAAVLPNRAPSRAQVTVFVVPLD